MTFLATRSPQSTAKHSRSIEAVLRDRRPEADVHSQIRDLATEIVTAGRAAGLGAEAIRDLAHRTLVAGVDHNHHQWWWCHEPHDSEADHSRCREQSSSDQTEPSARAIEQVVRDFEEWGSHESAVVRTIVIFDRAIDAALCPSRRAAK